MALAAPFCDYTPDCFWTPEDGESYGMAWRLQRDRQRYQLVDRGWKIRNGAWSHEGRGQWFQCEERALAKEESSPTGDEFRLPKRIYTGIDLFVFQKIGRHPTGVDQLLFWQWTMAARELEKEYVRRYGCCGETSEAAEHRGVCMRFSKPARDVFLERNSLETFVGECEHADEKRNRTHDFYLMCELCPRLTAERLVRDMADLIQFDTTLREARETLSKAEGELGRMLARASAIETLEKALEPYRKQILALQNSPLGFKTDSKTGYQWETVRSVVVIGLLHGFSMTENEINIIASGFYGAQAGYYRLVRQFPGVTNLKERLGVPVQGGADTCLVSGYVEWDLNGVTHRREWSKTEAMDLRMSVRVNSGMGADGVLGKAKRKAYKAVYEELTNTEIDEPGDDTAVADSNTIDGVAKPAQSTQAIGGPTTQAEPLKKHEQDWLESCQAGMDKAENIHDINVIVEDTKKRKPPMLVRVEAMAAEARKRFGSSAAKREPAGAGVS